MPQVVLLSLMVLNLVIATVKHKSERPDYNAYVTTLDMTLLASILYWGGFFG